VRNAAPIVGSLLAWNSLETYAVSVGGRESVVLLREITYKAEDNRGFANGSFAWVVISADVERE
jgi:hypothetical protein